MKTSIEWTDWSTNPIRARLGNGDGHYCEKVSPGCKNCYSSRLQPRFRMPVFQEQRGKAEPYLHVKAFDEVLSRRKPTKIFWCDMTDMFGAWVPNEWIAACFAVMAATPLHTHQVLTKRPERMLEWFKLGEELTAVAGEELAARKGWCHAHERAYWPLPNVWLGTSVENQETADERIPLLRQLRAVVDYRRMLLFASMEPLLEHVDLRSHLSPTLVTTDGRRLQPTADNEEIARSGGTWEWGLDWVIVGGESGQSARQFDIQWARSTVQQCRDAGVAAFCKQLGTVWAREAHADAKGGDPKFWPEDLRVREFPDARP